MAANAQNQPMSMRLPEAYEPLFVKNTNPVSATAKASSPAKSTNRFARPNDSRCRRWDDANSKIVMMTTSPSG